MTAFLIVGGIGLLLLLLSIIIGDLFDFLDGFVSGTAIGAGAALFGASGVLTVVNGGPAWLAYALAAVFGLAAVLLSSRLTKVLHRSSEQVSHEVVGLTGVTTERTGSTAGEVKLNHARELSKRLAFADEDLPKGTPVIVIEAYGSRVKVAPNR